MGRVLFCRPCDFLCLAVFVGLAGVPATAARITAAGESEGQKTGTPKGDTLLAQGKASQICREFDRRNKSRLQAVDTPAFLSDEKRTFGFDEFLAADPDGEKSEYFPPISSPVLQNQPYPSVHERGEGREQKQASLPSFVCEEQMQKGVRKSSSSCGWPGYLLADSDDEMALPTRRVRRTPATNSRDSTSTSPLLHSVNPSTGRIPLEASDADIENFLEEIEKELQKAREDHGDSRENLKHKATTELTSNTEIGNRSPTSSSSSNTVMPGESALSPLIFPIAEQEAVTSHKNSTLRVRRSRLLAKKTTVPLFSSARTSVRDVWNTSDLCTVRVALLVLCVVSYANCILQLRPMLHKATPTWIIRTTPPADHPDHTRGSLNKAEAAGFASGKSSTKTKESSSSSMLNLYGENVDEQKEEHHRDEHHTTSQSSSAQLLLQTCVCLPFLSGASVASRQDRLRHQGSRLKIRALTAATAERWQQLSLKAGERTGTGRPDEALGTNADEDSVEDDAEEDDNLLLATPAYNYLPLDNRDSSWEHYEQSVCCGLFPRLEQEEAATSHSSAAPAKKATWKLEPVFVYEDSSSCTMLSEHSMWSILDPASVHSVSTTAVCRNVQDHKKKCDREGCEGKNRNAKEEKEVDFARFYAWGSAHMISGFLCTETGRSRLARWLQKRLGPTWVPQSLLSSKNRRKKKQGGDENPGAPLHCGNSAPVQRLLSNSEVEWSTEEDVPELVLGGKLEDALENLQLALQLDSALERQALFRAVLRSAKCTAQDLAVLKRELGHCLSMLSS
ncbi:unnamed protein product [Amoebophrya sp. A120]|nr:unnamed protein product [Amoebophrya sp. A120]|eukprot:GSA120T00011701001.1